MSFGDPLLRHSTCFFSQLPKMYYLDQIEAAERKKTLAAEKKN